MTGPDFAFEVRPRLLAAYAEALSARTADLTSAGGAVAEVRVERGWFGKLPQAGFLAERYAAHQHEVLAEVGDLAAWLTAASTGLADCADRYSTADRVVTGAAETVRATLDVGIDIPGTAETPATSGTAETAEPRETPETPGPPPGAVADGRPSEAAAGDEAGG